MTKKRPSKNRLEKKEEKEDFFRPGYVFFRGCILSSFGIIPLIFFHNFFEFLAQFLQFFFLIWTFFLQLSLYFFYCV